MAAKDLSLCDLLNLSVSRTCDLFLTNRISRDDGVALPGLHYRRQSASVLQADSPGCAKRITVGGEGEAGL